MQAVRRGALSITGADSKIDTFIQITRARDGGGLGSPRPSPFEERARGRWRRPGDDKARDFNMLWKSEKRTASLSVTPRRG